MKVTKLETITALWYLAWTTNEQNGPADAKARRVQSPLSSAPPELWRLHAGDRVVLIAKAGLLAVIRVADRVRQAAPVSQMPAG